MRHRVLEITAPVHERHETTDNPAALARAVCAVADEHPDTPVSFTIVTTYENETPPVSRSSSSA